MQNSVGITLEHCPITWNNDWNRVRMQTWNVKLVQHAKCKIIILRESSTGIDRIDLDRGMIFFMISITIDTRPHGYIKQP